MAHDPRIEVRTATAERGAWIDRAVTTVALLATMTLIIFSLPA